MKDIISTYLKKRRFEGPWQFNKPITEHYDFCFAIPAFAEFEALPQTLLSIAKQNPTLLLKTIVIITINNAVDSQSEVINNNQATIEYLKSVNLPYELRYIDASSSGFELPLKHAGVGLARKIGMDLALPLLNTDGLICCIDADSPIAENYLDIVDNWKASSNLPVCALGFHHVVEELNLENPIRAYEKFLRSTATKMKDAGSPYGYHSIGSTIVCRANEYATIGGMPKRKATEDYYFLQEFAKYKGVDSIDEVLVYPSARASERVYLGTGFRMNQALTGFDISSLHYADNAYHILKEWLDIGTGGYNRSLGSVLSKCDDIHPNFHTFIINEKIEKVWDGLQNSSPTNHHFIKQFHRWFDGLKTIRLLKYFSK
jgi:hypothetical protein